MAFSDDYTDSEEESSDEESIESEPHTSDEEFIDDESVSSVSGSESEVEITEEETIVKDDEKELIFENIVTGMVSIPEDNSGQTGEIDQEQVQTKLQKIQEENPEPAGEDISSGSDDRSLTSSENDVLEKVDLGDAQDATPETVPVQKEIKESPQKKRRSAAHRADTGFREALIKLIYKK